MSRLRFLLAVNCGHISNVDVDAAGNIYISGLTGTIDHPTLNALYPSMIGNGDVWAAKFGDDLIVTPSPAVIDANNHELVPVTLAYADASSASSVHAASTASTSAPCSVSITSNEPVNGTGDGDTSPDWIVNDPHPTARRARRQRQRPDLHNQSGLPGRRRDDDCDGAEE